MTRITTVGYGDTDPVTAGGRTIAAWRVRVTQRPERDAVNTTSWLKSRYDSRVSRPGRIAKNQARTTDSVH